MRPGLDKTPFAFDPSPIRSSPRAAPSGRSAKNGIFELRNEAARPPSSPPHVSRAVPEHRNANAKGSERPNEASARSEPPRRVDPPRRNASEQPRTSSRREEAPRRTDPPGQVGEARPERDKADDEVPASTVEYPDQTVVVPVEAASAGPATTPSDPLGDETLVNESAGQDEAAPSGEMPLDNAPGDDAAPTTEALGKATPSGIGTDTDTAIAPSVPADEGLAIQPVASEAPPEDDVVPKVVGLQRAAAAIQMQNRELPPGLDHAIEKHAARNKTEGSEPSGLDIPLAAKADAASGKPFDVPDMKVDMAQGPPAPTLTGASQRLEVPTQHNQSQAAHPQLPTAQQVPLGAVAIEIGLKSLAGVNRFEIRLDPAELGGIDVRLDIGDAGDVKAYLVVDRVETLALLQRDAKTLERAFEQAGLKPSEGGIDLSLKDPSGDRRNADQHGSERGRRPERPTDDGTSAEQREGAPPPQRTWWRGSGRVDVRI
jgi:flagellar hook-length control protein FliK